MAGICNAASYSSDKSMLSSCSRVPGGGGGRFEGGRLSRLEGEVGGEDRTGTAFKHFLCRGPWNHRPMEREREEGGKEGGRVWGREGGRERERRGER